MGTRADGAACARRSAHGLPSHRFLAVHGHLERQGPVGVTLAEWRRAVENVERLKHTHHIMRVLITGHLGYIGSVLTSMLLKEDYNLLALESDQSRGGNFGE